MSSRLIAGFAATTAVLLAAGAATASATTIVLGITVGLITGVLVSVKTDDVTRPMHELLLDDPAPLPVGHAEVITESPVAAEAV